MKALSDPMRSPTPRRIILEAAPESEVDEAERPPNDSPDDNNSAAPAVGADFEAKTRPAFESPEAAFFFLVLSLVLAVLRLLELRVEKAPRLDGPFARIFSTIPIGLTIETPDDVDLRAPVGPLITPAKLLAAAETEALTLSVDLAKKSQFR